VVAMSSASFFCMLKWLDCFLFLKLMFWVMFFLIKFWVNCSFLSQTMG